MISATIKCLVWDLDNTLWQGTLLEDGDVRVSEQVREVIAALDARGILQSISSKNDHDLAWARLERLGLSEYFVLPRIGWGPKSAAVRELAERLRFAHSTLAFIDDQPAERAEVAFHLPEVRLYEPGQLPGLTALPEFSPATVTADSRQRRRMYQAGFLREAEKEAFAGPDEEFLRSLRLEMRIARAGHDDIARVEELTLRTSQMNATGVHYGAAALRELTGDPGHEVLVVSMSDRFGPHGAVGVVLLRVHPAMWHVKLLATSCRVVSFGAGAAILNWLGDQAATAGVHLAADFRPTDRNRMMEIAYRFAGYTLEPCACLDGHAVEGTQLLHQVPAPRPAPAAIDLTAPDLTARDLARAAPQGG
ncbi:HAD-IIIC family phosphatase [Nonomuraea sp. NPDC059023]|uniref:HAD-IIIC family phosphatase n=1 Tax=unclassified Nonomuraea TaxID=2593643 RepID=UPI0036C9AD59